MKTIKIKKLLVRFYNRVRSYNAMIFFQFVLYLTGTVTFITATDYFSKKPSVKIDIYTSSEPNEVNINPILVKDFYRQAKIKAPDLLLKHSLFGPLFNEPAVQENISTDKDWGNPLWCLAHIPPQEWEIDDFEGLLKKQNWYKLVWAWGFEHLLESIQLDEAQKNLETIKSKLSSKDYRDFIASLLYARTFASYIHIENNGDFDLRDVIITIPAPLARTTKSRDNNILSVETNEVQPNDIKKHKDRIEIFLPALKKRHGFSFCVQTRENSIREQEVSSSFQEDRVVSRNRIGAISIIVFGFMVIVQIIFRGKHYSCDDN